ncbi:MAG: NfeD family protein [Candidatus Bathyarchaeia archaeon]
MHAWLAFFGGACAVAGILLLFAAFSGVSYNGVDSQLSIAVAATVLVIAALVAWIFYAAIRTRYSRIRTGEEALIGARGKAITDLTPEGTIRVVGEFWQAKTVTGTVKAGEPVQVTGLDGMFLVVKPVEEKA